MMMYESRNNKSILLKAATAVLLVVACTTFLAVVDAIDHAAVKEASKVCTVVKLCSVFLLMLIHVRGDRLDVYS